MGKGTEILDILTVVGQIFGLIVMTILQTGFFIVCFVGGTMANLYKNGFRGKKGL